MASTTQKDTTFIPDWQTASERAIKANERLIEAGRKATGASLDGVAKYLGGVTAYERKLSEQSKLAPVAGLLEAHADLADDLTAAGLRVVRELIAY
jgi:curli biogenesis system outer membrane secretion channel CsgG